MGEIKIPLNLPPYEFCEEDKKLASGIKGLMFSHVINPKPFAPVFHFHIGEQTTLQDLEDFLDTVPAEFNIEYSHVFKPDESSARAIATVQTHESDYIFYHGGHAGDKIWKPMTRKVLLEELFSYRRHQDFGTIKVTRTNSKVLLDKKCIDTMRLTKYCQKRG